MTFNSSNIIKLLYKKCLCLMITEKMKNLNFNFNLKNLNLSNKIAAEYVSYYLIKKGFINSLISSNLETNNLIKLENDKNWINKKLEFNLKYSFFKKLIIN